MAREFFNIFESSCSPCFNYCAQFYNLNLFKEFTLGLILTTANSSAVPIFHQVQSLRCIQFYLN